MNKLIAILILAAATAATAERVRYPDGSIRDGWPTRIGDSIPDRAMAEAAGYRVPTQAELDAHAATLAEQAEASEAAELAAESARIEGLAGQIGGLVTLLRLRLVQLGYDLPSDSTTIFVGLAYRSNTGELSEVEEMALSKAADLYSMLQNKGVTDSDINAVWNRIKE